METVSPAALYLVCVDIAQSAVSIVNGSETRMIEATNSGVKSILQSSYKLAGKRRKRTAKRTNC